MDEFMTLEPKTYSMKLQVNRIRDDLIVFRHGHIAITNYKLGDCPEFEKSLSKWDPMYYRYNLMGGYYVKRLKEFRVNRGYAIQSLRRYFPGHTMKVDNHAYPSDMQTIELTTPPKDDFQKVAITFMACQGQYKKNAQFTQQLIEAPTGSGKSYLGAVSAAVWSGRCVVFVPISKLLTQWEETFLKFTSIDSSEILIVKGTKKCEKIRNGEYGYIKVFLFSVDTFDAYRRTYGDMMTIDMLYATNAHIKIIDEVHKDMRIASAIEALSNFRMNYYMSASPGRADRREDRIFATSFVNVPKFGSSFIHEEEKHINILVKKYDFFPSKDQERQMYRPKIGLNGKIYEKVLINACSEQQNSFIESVSMMLRWSKQLVKSDNKILILTHTKDGTHFVKHIADKIFSPDETAVYYSSLSNQEKEHALKQHVIIATEGSLGTGADIKGIQHVHNIITYSNKIGAKQYPGRGRAIDDKTPIIYIEYVNMAYMRTYRQFRAREPHLIKTARNGKISFIS